MKKLEDIQNLKFLKQIRKRIQKKRGLSVEFDKCDNSVSSDDENIEKKVLYTVK